MKVLDLFCGLGGWGRAFRDRGHDVVGVDWDPKFEPDIVADIFDLTPRKLPGPFDIVLASPPCERFSVLQIGRNWHEDGRPKTAGAAKAEALVWATRILIEALDPAFFVIENPMGKLRALRPLASLNMRLVTYCQYGAPWRKPTDLWGGFPPSLNLRPPCENGDDCHLRAGRGDRAGVQDDRGDAAYAWLREIEAKAIERYESAQNGGEKNGRANTLSQNKALARVVADEGFTKPREDGGDPTRKRTIMAYQSAELFGTWNQKSIAAMRSLIPPELSDEVCVAAERDIAADLTWRAGHRLHASAVAGTLFEATS